MNSELFAQLAGKVVENLPELEPELARQFIAPANEGALKAVLGAALTRENLNQAIAAHGQLVPVLAEKLLGAAGTVTFSGVKAKNPPRVRYYGENLKIWFAGVEEEESSEKPITFSHQQLLRSSVDGPIIAELGGARKARITFTRVLLFIQAQEKGEHHQLLADGQANVFYVPDANGLLRTVLVLKTGGEWHMIAHEIEYKVAHDRGDRVFSPVP
jgi:hypothetical protein